MSDDFVIRTKELGRRYGRRWVVDGVDLCVPRGAVFGFLGLNGAGKSTTMRMLMGLLRRHVGDARVLGLDPQRDGVAVKRRVGYVAEQPAFYDWMTPDEICGFSAHYRPAEWDHAFANDLLRRFKVPRERPLRELSKGQKAKTALVLAMGFRPDLLLLDEPTSGLDPIARREFIEGVLAEYQEEGKTVLISSHLVNELAGLVDHVGILHEGQMLLTATTEDFLASIHRVSLAFDSQVPAGLACKGMLRQRGKGREVEVIVRGVAESEFVAELQRFSPSNIKVERLNLEDAFIELVGAAEALEPALEPAR